MEEIKFMSCADCEHRMKDMCCLFDDVILSYANTCFMDSNKEDGDLN